MAALRCCALCLLLMLAAACRKGGFSDAKKTAANDSKSNTLEMHPFADCSTVQENGDPGLVLKVKIGFEGEKAKQLDFDQAGSQKKLAREAPKIHKVFAVKKAEIEISPIQEGPSPECDGKATGRRTRLKLDTAEMSFTECEVNAAGKRDFKWTLDPIVKADEKSGCKLYGEVLARFETRQK